MKKYIILFLLICSLFQKSFSQEFFPDWIYVHREICIDIFSSPITEYELEFESTDGYTRTFDVPLFASQSGISYEFGFQFKFFEFSDETSLGLDIPIKFGFSTPLFVKTHDVAGFGYFSSPINLNFSYGLGSTYQTAAEYGFNIGAGLNFISAPLALAKDVDFDMHYRDEDLGITYDYTRPVSELDYKKFSITPVFKLGFRYWNKNNVVNEFFVLFNYGKSTSYLELDSENKTATHRVYNFSLGYSALVNY